LDSKILFPDSRFLIYIINEEKSCNGSDVLNDESLRDLPYKIELNEYRKIEMSPASNQHGLYQAEITQLLTKLPSGKVITECSIQTSQGVKVADAGLPHLKIWKRKINDLRYKKQFFNFVSY